MSIQCRKKKSVISWNIDQQMGIVTKKWFILVFGSISLLVGNSFNKWVLSIKQFIIFIQKKFAF